MDLTDIKQISFDIGQICDTDILGTPYSDVQAWKRVGELPKAVVRQMEREEARKARKKLIREERRKGKRSKPGVRGARHWKAKEATLKRRREKTWANNPLTCILYRDRYKCKNIDRQLWERHVMPIWKTEEPAMLSVEFPRSAGTKLCPWSMFNIKIIHKEKGILLDGESLHLYVLSGGQ